MENVRNETVEMPLLKRCGAQSRLRDGREEKSGAEAEFVATRVGWVICRVHVLIKDICVYGFVSCKCRNSQKKRMPYNSIEVCQNNPLLPLLHQKR
jgi:hypothetical protein